MSANDLPDELWRKILGMGVKSSKISYEDLCCVSISCRRLHRLSCEDSLWYRLISLDFPCQFDATSHSSAKCLYRTWFERQKYRNVAAHQRALLRKESEIAELYRRIREMETRVSEETGRLKAAMVEFSNLQKVRQVSVALKIWQPEIVCTRQKQIVEQNAVPIGGRLHSLEMEIKLCKQQIAGSNSALREAKRGLDLAKGELEFLKYHPLQDYRSRHSGELEFLKYHPLQDYRPRHSGNQESNSKRKKLKASIRLAEKDSDTS